MIDLNRYNRYIAGLPDRELTKEDLLVPELLIEEQDDLKMYYIPFNTVNAEAKVFIIGITPGFTQMEIAIRQARTDFLNGLPDEEVYRRAKRQASFAGSMRRNLIAMLDELGLPDALSLRSSADLFQNRNDLLHTTSVVRYPVFAKGRNYTGHNPEILKSPMLSRFACGLFRWEIETVGQALVIPLGKAVSGVLRHFINEGIVPENRCLLDFPHPSGANGHRRPQFESLKSEHRKRIADWFGASQA
ncbi:hypothetical protein ACFSL6_21255 [Paenibacillus thailandensis]|uniref:Uracil-DNA glycosylase-like domain-containing protein n=1 Tax=Paenibacillus thailandensis TaxID=393250 RepID=A0ABW5QSH7_9BACL